jgi:hypothetical protein
MGKMAEKICDLVILSATNQTILRSLARTYRKRAKKDAGPVYVLEDGEVKVWGVD